MCVPCALSIVFDCTYGQMADALAPNEGGEGASAFDTTVALAKLGVSLDMVDIPKKCTLATGIEAVPADRVGVWFIETDQGPHAVATGNGGFVWDNHNNGGMHVQLSSYRDCDVLCALYFRGNPIMEDA